ncbi:MAG: hypothetical protein KA792_10150 [Bacteroidales bacterium]|nr:hypothetical protein [Bacteroidales bacterium]
MPDFFDNNNPLPFNIDKLNAQREKVYARFKNKLQNPADYVNIKIQFTLLNTFWGNSWNCNQIISIPKNKNFELNIDIQTSHYLSEIWSCFIVSYRSPEDHIIYLVSTDGNIEISIMDNNFTFSGINTGEIKGKIEEIASEKILK